MLEPGASVILVAHAQFRGVYTELVRRLRNELDVSVHLYTSTAQQTAFYKRNHADLFASITTANTLYTACHEHIENEAAVIAEAKRNEAELSATINELAVSDRHLGRGFSPGGYRHPRSYISEQTNYIQLLNAYNVTIEYWRTQISSKQPALILNPTKVASVIARGAGILIRTLASSRYENFYYWAHNEFLETPEIEQRYNSVQLGALIEFDRPNADHLNFRDIFRRKRSYLPTISSSVILILRRFYWKIRDYDKSRTYYWTDELSYLWRNCRAIREMTSGHIARLDQLSDDRFLFFPLATEPEVSLQRLSPEHLFQLEAIISVARDAPAGVMIAVKEHYAACGRRPRDFYRQINELKNVLFVNMGELGLEAVRKSRVVVTISGSAGMEGAAMGKPVISFGRHNIYNFLPHVFVVTDPVRLKEKIDFAFSEDFNVVAARRDGQRFMSALLSCSFDLGSFTATNPGCTEDGVMNSCYRALIDSISQTARKSALSM